MHGEIPSKTRLFFLSRFSVASHIFAVSSDIWKVRRELTRSFAGMQKGDYPQECCCFFVCIKESNVGLVENWCVRTKIIYFSSEKIIYSSILLYWSGEFSKVLTPGTILRVLLSLKFFLLRFLTLNSHFLELIRLSLHYVAMWKSRRTSNFEVSVTWGQLHRYQDQGQRHGYL